MVLIAIYFAGLLAGAQDFAAALDRAQELNQRHETQQALQAFRELLVSPQVASSGELRAYVISQIADAQLELGEYKPAELAVREALRLLTTAGAEETPTFAVTEGILAQALRAEGDYRNAKRIAKDAVDAARRSMNASDPRLGILLTDYAQALEDAGDPRRAEVFCVQAVEIFRNSGAATLNLASAYHNLAVVYTRERKFHQALDAVNTALSIWSREPSPNHPFIVDGLTTKIAIYCKLKRLPEAEALIPEALEMGIARYGRDNTARAILLTNAAGVYAAGKKYGESEPLLREAVEICSRRLPLGHPLLNTILLQHAFVLEKLHRNDEASLEKARSAALTVAGGSR